MFRLLLAKAVRLDLLQPLPVELSLPGPNRFAKSLQHRFLRFHHRRIDALRIRPKGRGHVSMAGQTLHRLRVALLIDEERRKRVP